MRGRPSRKSRVASHFDLKATHCTNNGSKSVPFRVSSQTGPVPDARCVRLSIRPSASSCRSRTDNILGVICAIDLDRSLNLPIPRNPISLRINSVHFLPRTPNWAFKGHSSIGTFPNLHQSFASAKTITLVPSCRTNQRKNLPMFFRDQKNIPSI